MTEFKNFLLAFTVVYLIYFFAIIIRKKGKDKLKDSIEVKCLKNKFKLNLDLININMLSHIIALSNSFIIALTVTLISFIENLILKMLVGFILLIILEMLIYSLIGNYFKCKERGNKNV